MNEGKIWTAEELEEMPTISCGQADNLKIETEDMRVWLSRCGVEDGMPYDNMVTIERLREGRWVTVHEYPG